MSYYRQGPHRPGGPGVTLGVPALTPMVRGIMIVCGVVWLLQILFAQFGIDLARIFGVVPARVIRGWIWQPVTSMFLHDTGSFFHILFNMLMLWMFGGELERHWGSKAFLRFYVVCGVGAGLFATVMGLFSESAMWIATIGASGAIFGVIMAYGLVFSERVVLFMMIFPMKARTMALILFALAFFYTMSGGGSGISHVSHLGGAVVGYLYLRRAWRVGDFVRELKWKIRRRRFKVMSPDDRNDPDHWVN
jgi:membrane associated rhomboid family serine protease